MRRNPSINSKKEALKNANLDQMLTKETLAGILTAENFRCRQDTLMKIRHSICSK